jgi:hypothetical protein
MEDTTALIDRFENFDLLPKDPLVTVWFVTYNHAPFISQALDSVLMQEVDFPYEILVREDCSTDGTRDILLAYQRKHPDKIRLWLAKENLYSKGIRVRMVNATRGRFIARLEGDDYWTDPHKLQDQVNALVADPHAAGCFTNGWNERDEIRSDYVKSWLGKERPAPITVLEDIIGQNFVPTASLVYRKEAQSLLPLSVRKNALGDQALHVQLLLSGHYIYLDRHTCVRRVHAGGIISMKDALHKLEVNIRSLDAIAELLEGRSTEVVHARMAGLLEQVVPVAARRGEVARARQYLARLRATPGVRLGWRRNLWFQLLVSFPRLMDRYLRFRKRRSKERLSA